MNILQYLQKKYQKETPTTISKAEADAFAIPYPLQAGWLTKHGPREITDFMRDRVTKVVSKKLSRRQKKGKPHSAYHQRGMDILRGVVTVTKFAPSTTKLAAQPKQYKGGIGVLGLLGVVFITLKLLGITAVASWSWWWVTAPLWGGLALVFVLVVLMLAGAAVLASLRGR